MVKSCQHCILHQLFLLYLITGSVITDERNRQSVRPGVSLLCPFRCTWDQLWPSSVCAQRQQRETLQLIGRLSQSDMREHRLGCWQVMLSLERKMKWFPRCDTSIPRQLLKSKYLLERNSSSSPSATKHLTEHSKAFSHHSWSNTSPSQPSISHEGIERQIRSRLYTRCWVELIIVSFIRKCFFRIEV